MLLSESDITTLLRQKPITDEWPWNTNDERTIHGNIKDVLAEICRTHRLLNKTEFGHYGSGYASYVDCWFYREDDEFRADGKNSYWGLVVLFSTLSKYYVIGEGQKARHETGWSTYLPSFQFVDEINQPAIRRIAGVVCKILTNRGWVRASADDLALPLARDISVPTILADRPWHHFDALFYWED